MKSKKSLLYTYLIILVLLIIILFSAYFIRKNNIEHFSDNENIIIELGKISNALNKINEQLEFGLNIRSVQYPYPKK
jgi:sensor domain CHASE-containing protein